MPDDIIISQQWGGLGDNLQFSTLAEGFFNQGRKVYISSGNACRTKESYDLVWGSNPFIAGVSDLPPNAGQCREAQYLGLSHIPNFIQRWERAHGLHPANRYPKIYYQPKTIDSLRNYCIIDVGSTTTQYTSEQISGFLQIFQKLHGAEAKDMLQVTFPDKFSKHSFSINGVDTILANDIFHYCDMIHSVKGFATVFSGACVMASAIRQDRDRPSIFCLVERQYYNVGFFAFPNVRYYVV